MDNNCCSVKGSNWLVSSYSHSSNFRRDDIDRNDPSKSQKSNHLTYFEKEKQNIISCTVDKVEILRSKNVIIAVNYKYKLKVSSRRTMKDTRQTVGPSKV